MLALYETDEFWATQLDIFRLDAWQEMKQHATIVPWRHAHMHLAAAIIFPWRHMHLAAVMIVLWRHIHLAAAMIVLWRHMHLATRDTGQQASDAVETEVSQRLDKLFTRLGVEMSMEGGNVEVNVFAGEDKWHADGRVVERIAGAKATETDVQSVEGLRVFAPLHEQTGEIEGGTGEMGVESEGPSEPVKDRRRRLLAVIRPHLQHGEIEGHLGSQPARLKVALRSGKIARPDRLGCRANLPIVLCQTGHRAGGGVVNSVWMRGC